MYERTTDRFEIYLCGMSRNQLTWEFFSAAERTGDPYLLDETDALSLVMYQDAYEACGSKKDWSFPAEVCRQRVAREDIRNRPYSVSKVWNKLATFPKAKQNDMRLRARIFIDDARTVFDIP